jgi:hypothetical protein
MKETKEKLVRKKKTKQLIPIISRQQDETSIVKRGQRHETRGAEGSMNWLRSFCSICC